MVAILRTPAAPRGISAPAPEPSQPAAGPAFPAHSYLARLCALHDEAAETALLANLLGRAPWVAGGLAVGALVATLFFWQATWPGSALTWLMLVLGASAVIARAYGRAIEAPFDRQGLHHFANVLSATLVYAGTVWGAGLFLTLPSGVGFATAIGFGVGMSAIIAFVLRARDLALFFLFPATAMSAFCALMHNGASTLGILVAGAAVAAVTGVLERNAHRPQHG